MKKIIFCMLGAAAGICLAIVVHCSFMITEMYDSSMFPAIEPGQKVLVFMLAGIDDKDRTVIWTDDILGKVLTF